MAMFLSGVSTIIIQRVGRWESDAFMEYIREQVESFTLGVSEKMIQNESFYHLNNKTDKHSGYIMGSNQSYKGDGEPIVTPSLADFSYYSLKSTDCTNHNILGKGKGVDGGHAKSS